MRHSRGLVDVEGGERRFPLIALGKMAVEATMCSLLFHNQELVDSLVPRSIDPIDVDAARNLFAFVVPNIPRLPG